MNKKIIEFYKEIQGEMGFVEKVQQKMKGVKDFSELKKVIEKEILPIAEKKGYKFTAEELIDFEKEAIEKLSKEELSEISGGMFDGIVRFAIFLSNLIMPSGQTAAPVVPEMIIEQPANIANAELNEEDTEEVEQVEIEEEEAENEVTYDEFKRLSSEKRAKVTKVVIPYGVTTIEKGAFSGCTSLKEVYIQHGVQTIETEAFSGCSNLKTLTIPSSISKIGDDAFKGCDNLTIECFNKVYNRFKDTGLKDVKVDYLTCTAMLSNGKIEKIEPQSFKSLSDEYKKTIVSIELTGGDKIDDKSFEGCENLQEITMPESITSIGKNAFYGCRSLTGINIPNSVTTIGWRAFSGCSSLTEINIPNSVTEIGEGAFKGCSSLTGINIPNSVTEIESSAFSGCRSLTGINIPNSVTRIGMSAFSGCSSLTGINIPNSVTEIGISAFYGCKSLELLNVPESVTTIGDYAFCGCSSLTSITIPDNVTTIGSMAFKSCDNLVLTIPKSVNDNVGKISGCKSVEVMYEFELTDGKKVNLPIKTFEKYGYQDAKNVRSITIPDTVTTIGTDTFYNFSGVTTIKIPNSVTTIDESAFEGCRSLESITIPDSVTTIGDKAFSGCESLGTIEIPDGVTTIGNYAFWKCSNLTSINIPESVKNIGENTFDKCNNNLKINCSCEEGVYIPQKVHNKVIFKKPIFKGPLKKVPDYLIIIQVPDGFKEIGSRAFENCKYVGSIVIPDTVTKIDATALKDCSKDLKIKCSEKVKKLLPQELQSKVELINKN